MITPLDNFRNFGVASDIGHTAHSAQNVRIVSNRDDEHLKIFETRVICE